MRYLSAEDILVLHSFAISETGGSYGVRQPEILKSIIHKPQSQFGGKDLYKGVFKKAAVLLEAIANYHVFVDGNKRTSFMVTARFLHINGYEIAAANKDVENTVVAVATKEINIEELEMWLKKNSRRIKK